MTIAAIVQYAFILLLVILFVYYGLIVIAVRRAAGRTKIPLPHVWTVLMIVTFCAIVAGIFAIVLWS